MAHSRAVREPAQPVDAEAIICILLLLSGMCDFVAANAPLCSSNRKRDGSTGTADPRAHAEDLPALA